ncbi:MAG: hypothetical protein KatS3mg100_068 [Candidatus Parcubacteria bacterium]|nr:MAG: hypothetical protein KatS3mg100_068 [Candidatus Parcubacteria bacterium]
MTVLQHNSSCAQRAARFENASSLGRATRASGTALPFSLPNSDYHCSRSCVCATHMRNNRIKRVESLRMPPRATQGGRTLPRLAPQQCNTNSFIVFLFSRNTTRCRLSHPARLPISIPHLATVEEGANVDNFGRTRKAVSKRKAYRKSPKDASTATRPFTTMERSGGTAERAICGAPQRADPLPTPTVHQKRARPATPNSKNTPMMSISWSHRRASP